MTGVKSMVGERQIDQDALSYKFSLERHVPETHLLRAIDRFVDLDRVRGYLAPLYSDPAPFDRSRAADPHADLGYCSGIRLKS
jgi:hypothetical protein